KHDLPDIVNKSIRRIRQRLGGSEVELLRDGLRKTSPAPLMRRTRTNKIVVLPPSPRRLHDNSPAGQWAPRKSEGDALVGERVNVRIERANGFSLYGTPLPT